MKQSKIRKLLYEGYLKTLSNTKPECENLVKALRDMTTLPENKK